MLIPYECPLCGQATETPLDDIDTNLKSLISEAEKRIVVSAIKKFDGNMTSAARFLQIEYYQIRHLVEKHGINPKQC